MVDWVSFIPVHLKLGEVADPYTPVWIQLVGEKGESGQIQIKPGYGPNDKFEKDRIYKVVARVANIGRVSALGGNSLVQTLTVENYRSESLTPDYEFVDCCVIIQTKTTEQFFHVLLFIGL